MNAKHLASTQRLTTPGTGNRSLTAFSAHAPRRRSGTVRGRPLADLDGGRGRPSPRRFARRWSRSTGEVLGLAQLQSDVQIQAHLSTDRTGSTPDKPRIRPLATHLQLLSG